MGFPAELRKTLWFGLLARGREVSLGQPCCVTARLQAAPHSDDWLVEPELAMATLRHPPLPASWSAHPSFPTLGHANHYP